MQFHNYTNLEIFEIPEINQIIIDYVNAIKLSTTDLIDDLIQFVELFLYP